MIERLEKMRDKLNLMIEKLKERTYDKKDKINEITIKPQTVYVHKCNTETIADKTDILRNTALEAMKKYGTDITRRMYFTEYNADNPTAIYYCVSVPSDSSGDGIKKLPEFKALSTFYHGAYEEIPKVHKSLIEYAEQNNIKLSGVLRSLYVEGPPQHKDKNKFITQVIALIDED